MTTARVTGIAAGAAAAAALALAWIWLAPVQLGGGTSYAVIVGSSMEPGLHRGDLAVVRARDSYRAGDVVLYDSRELGAKVLHRIVRVERGRFVLKGDNNSFLDAERPTQEQILGTLWVRAPAVGRATDWLRQPLHSALLIGLVTLLALGGGVGAGAAVRRGSRPSAQPYRIAPPPAPRAEPTAPAPLLTALAVSGLACGVLAAVAFSRPTTQVQTVESAYEHQGRFEYEAPVARSAAYPDGQVGTGEPVFLRLVPRLRASFSYRLASELPVDARGTVALDARLSDGRGWERVLPVAPERPFSGQTATASGVLDLARIERIVEQVRELTGTAQTAYTVVLLPRVQVGGTVGEERVDATFAPRLSFDLGDLRLQPNFEAGAGLGPLAPREPGTGTRRAAATVSFGSLSVPVATARRASLLGGALLLLLAGSALALRRRGGAIDEHDRIAARYGHLLVPVVRRPEQWANVVEVGDFDSLARLADRYGRLILQVVGDRSYVVEDGRNAYRYSVSAPKPLAMVWAAAASDARAGR